MKRFLRTIRFKQPLARHIPNRGAALLIGFLAILGSTSVAGAVSRPAPIIKNVITTKKVIALTFDDGPNPKWTPKILSILKHDRVPATFFVIGSHTIQQPALLDQEIKDGMEIGNHGAQHISLKGRSAEAVRKEIEENARILTSLGAPKPSLYRLPAGVSDATARLVLGELGYQVIGWSIDPRDWRHRYTAQQMTDLVLKQAAPGAIVIFHDGPNSSQATVDAVSAIIPALRKDGYQFLTVSQLLKEERIGRVSGTE